MAKTQDIIYGETSQTIYYDAPDRASALTSVSVFETSEDDDTTAESATTGSMSLESVDTVLDATSGVGESDPRKVFITDTSNIEQGREYLITEDGASEEIEVAEIVAGDYVVARVPLMNTYSVGATFQSTRMQISILDSWAADEDNLSGGRTPHAAYRVRWSWDDAAGNKRIAYSYFDLVRVAGGHDVNATDIERTLPGWIRMLPVDHRDDRGQGLIDEAYTQVENDLAQEGIADQQVRSPDRIRELVIKKTIYLTAWAREFAGGDPLITDRALIEYNHRLEQLVKITNNLAVDLDNDGSSQYPSNQPIWSK